MMRVDATAVVLLVCAAAHPALCWTWFDGSASENSTHPVLAFFAVTSSPDPVVDTSSPDPVVHGVNQTITSAPCCEMCSWPRSKYYSVDAARGFCGETCMLSALFPLFKRFEPNLTAASARDEHACAEQLTPRGEHYTEYNRTVTHGVPGLTITLDLYSGPKVRAHVV